MRMNRNDLLEVLRRGDYGIVKTETLEQSNCFIFQDGMMITFDGETMASLEFDVGFEAAVPGEDFRKVLQGVPDEEIDLSVQGSELIIKGKNKRAGITVAQEIVLPFTDVPTPGKMHRVSEELTRHLVQASRICSHDHSNPRTTHVHITPSLVEATDGNRLYRARVDTGLQGEVLIPASPLENIGRTNLTKASIQEG